MRTEVINKQVPCYDVTYDDFGMAETITQTGTETVTVIDIYADSGKLFARISDNAVMGDHITIGTDDSIDNYEEIDA